MRIQATLPPVSPSFGMRRSVRALVGAGLIVLGGEGIWATHRAQEECSYRGEPGKNCVEWGTADHLFPALLWDTVAASILTGAGLLVNAARRPKKTPG
jgi:hypothetical protein